MELVAEFKAHPRHAMSVLFTPGGEELVTCGMDGMAQVWSVPSFELVRTFQGHEKCVNGLCLTRDGGTLITGSTDRTVRVWDYLSGELLKTLTGHRNTVTAPMVSPDGKWIASPSYDGTVRLWPFDEDADAEPTVLRGHPKNVTSVAFTPDSTVLAASGVFDEIQLWSVPEGTRLHSLTGHSVAVGTLGIAPGSRIMWSLGHEGTLVARSTDDWSDDWSIVRSVDLSSYKPFSFALSADGSMIGVTFDHGAGVVSAESMDLLAYVKTPVKGMYGAGFSSDNRLMAAAAADGRCRVWALEDVRSPGTTP